MKHAKRITSFLLALVMVLALGVTAFAEDSGNSITVQNAQKSETYKIYKMLDLSTNDDKTAYTYTVATNWTNFFTNSGAGAEYVTITNGYVSWNGNKTAERMAAFGKLAATYATTSANGVTTAATDITPGEDGDITFSNLTPGYYLITSTNGTEVIIDTTPSKPNPSIEEKNTDATIDKTVKEDSTGVYGDSNDADIGDTIEYKVEISVKNGAKNYVLHDQMSSNLSFNSDSVKVYKGTIQDDNLVDAGNYEVKTTELTHTECTFEVSFKQTFLDNLKTGDTLIVTYTATLNENAQVATEIPNKAMLTWGNNSNTEWDQTVTKTWEIKVFKFTNTKGEGETTTETPLAGATFTLSKSSDGSSPIALINKGNNVYRVAKTDEDNTVTVITTDATGKFEIEGLDSDTYYLTETQAPAGYNKLNSAITVKVEDSGTVKYTYKDTESTAKPDIKIENKTGTELPSTGGVGTTIFYVLGSVLVIGAAVLLITKKRMNAEA